MLKRRSKVCYTQASPRNFSITVFISYPETVLLVRHDDNNKSLKILKWSNVERTDTWLIFLHSSFIKNEFSCRIRQEIVITTTWAFDFHLFGQQPHQRDKVLAKLESNAHEIKNLCLAHEVAMLLKYIHARKKKRLKERQQKKARKFLYLSADLRESKSA